MNTKCPVCQKENIIQPGKYICSDCKSKFEFHANGKIVLIKRNKFDFWNFLISLVFPTLFVILFFNELSRENFYNDFNIFAGLLMIFYPFLIVIRQFFHLGLETVTILGLYLRFFRKELKKEDFGRQIGFYLTFATNITGIILIFIKLIN